MIETFIRNIILFFILLLSGILTLLLIMSTYQLLKNYKASKNKGFLTCYIDKGIILSKYGYVKFDGNAWTISGKRFSYKTNSKCLFVSYNK